MDQTSNGDAPIAVALLPVAVAAHIAEEWYGGFTVWASGNLGIGIGDGRFLVVNAIGLILAAIGAASAYRDRRAAWIGVAMAALVGLNTVVHMTLSIITGTYSPGTVTGVLLYIPLSAVILVWAVRHLSRRVVGGAVLCGVVIHAVATLSALS